MYGIDVSTYQRTLDMNTIRNAGNEFVGVKAVASYRPELTIAADYQNNVDRVMAAQLFKYGYTVPNNQNSPEATAQFTMANMYRRMPSDCHMLDNEPLDAFGIFWGDDEVYRYWTEMRTLGWDLARGIEYCPAALTRSRGRWSKLIQLRDEWGLQIQWVSYGDNDPYYEDGEQPNYGNTGLGTPEAESHQFTSSYTVPGYGGLIDRVYSRLTVAQMFGEGMNMPRTPKGAFDWAANEAANGNVLDDWAGWCEKFINNSGAFNQAFGSALIAGSNSGPLRTDYENAPVGAIVYWGGVGGFGHDAWIYERGSDPLLLMASSSVDNQWGHNIGTIRLSRYQAKFGHPLRGWTLRHGTETLDFSGTAGGGGTKPIVVNEEDEMIYLPAAVDDPQGRPAITLSSGRRYPVPAGNEGIVKGSCSKAYDVVNAAQYDIISAAWLQGEYVSTLSQSEIEKTIEEAIDKALANATIPPAKVDWDEGAKVINDDLAERIVR